MRYRMSFCNDNLLIDFLKLCMSMPSGTVYCSNCVRVSIMNPNFRFYNPTIKTCSRVQYDIRNLLGSNFPKQMHMQETQVGRMISLPIISCMVWWIETQLILVPRDLSVSVLKSDAGMFTHSLTVLFFRKIC